MDLIIKNLERLKDYSNGNHKPIERVVIDFDKLATEDFAQVFFDACEKYKEPKIKSKPVKSCGSCKYRAPGIIEPCGSCITMGKDNYYPYYEPEEPTLKEVTERMQSEFDATGKDVKIFMNERIIKK